MGCGSSLSTRSTIYRLSKFLASSPLGSVYSSRIAASIDNGGTAVSTAVLGSSLGLTALYLAGIHDHPRLCSGYRLNPFDWFGCQPTSTWPHAGPKHQTSFKWLDYPASYVPPKVDLFSDDNTPFGFSSSPSCPIDSEHLERSFDTLRYQHAVKRLGVPSVMNSGIRIVTCSTGSQSPGGTSTYTLFRAGSTSPGGTPNPFLDRPSHPRDGGSNGSAGSGSGSGPGDRNADRPGVAAVWRKSSAQHGYKRVRFATPPPPPPPPPGSSDSEDDDDNPGFNSSDSDMGWKAILIGAVIGHLVNKLLSAMKIFSRKAFRASRTANLDILENEPDTSGIYDGVDLELDSDVTPLPAFVDEFFPIDLTTNYTDFYMNDDHVDSLYGLVTSPLYDVVLTQLLTFSAGTGKAIAALLLLISYSVLRRRITAMVRGIFRLGSALPVKQVSTTAVIRADECEETNGTIVEANDDTIRGDTDLAPVEAPAPDEDLDVDPTVVFGNALSLATVSQAPVEAQNAPVEDFDTEPTIVLEAASFWTLESPVEESFPFLDRIRAEVDLPLIVVENSHVEASAPEYRSPFDESIGSDDVDGFPFSFESTKSYSRAVGMDSFNWDCHSSFRCSTPLDAGNLSLASSFDYDRGHIEESLDPDSDVANATTTTSIADDALQELEKTRKNLDTIIEAQIKRAESSYQSKPYLDPFESHLQRINGNHRTLSSSIWANPTATSLGQGRFTPAVAASSSARVDFESRSFTRLSPPNHITGTSVPDTTQPESDTTNAQKTPGRRRRYRPRNRGRGLTAEQSVEEAAGEDVSSDIPDWANA